MSSEHCHKDFEKGLKKEIKHFQGPKDIVLFNGVFWDNTTSFTG